MIFGGRHRERLTNATFNPIKAIFLDALENHPPAGWDAFLDEARGGAPKLAVARGSQYR